MLVEVAHRLQGIVRDSDTIARIGGDEFIVLISGLGNDSAPGCAVCGVRGPKGSRYPKYGTRVRQYPSSRFGQR
jgi:GGDEF domain-containing protein